ncbi:MAG TPA: DUF3788 family protein [Lacunisphaera sp.]|nr:DUF3788 family protein [Lacunisphaera sp.]
MKTPVPMDPTAALPDATIRPSAADLHAALGAAAAPLEAVITALCAAHPDITTAWQYSPRSGWYQLLLRRKRRLLYLVPRRGDFRAMMILGGKALADLKAGPHARKMPALLKGAKRYPEGTAFTFTRATLDPGLLTAFLAAKLAH